MGTSLTSGGGLGEGEGGVWWRGGEGSGGSAEEDLHGLPEPSPHSCVSRSGGGKGAEEDGDNGLCSGLRCQSGGEEEAGWRRMEDTGRRKSNKRREIPGYGPSSSVISVQVGHRPTSAAKEQRSPVRHTIRRNNNLVQALSVPRMTLYNVRSAWAKWDNIAEDMQMRETDVMFLTEVWEKSENKKHKKAIETMLELKGLKYISTPRPGARRGGGTAILSAEKNFQLTKLNINIPHPLEVCFALLRPNNPTGRITKFICISFYSPPRSKSNKKLIDFLTKAVAQLRAEHQNGGLVLAADINDLKLPVLLAYDPSLKQIVKGFTNKKRDKVLDCFITDLHSLLQEPTILPPMQVDDGKKGKDGDHMGVECLPRNNLANLGSKLREKIQVQPYPESGLVKFGLALMKENWEVIEDSMSSSSMVNIFEQHAKIMVDQHFPRKVVSVGEGDLPYFTEDLRKLKRQRQRVYRKCGRRSEKYVKLKQKFDLKKKREAIKYVDKINQEVVEGRRGSGYCAIRKLGNRPGDTGRRKEVVVPSYVDQRLSPLEAADRLATYFAQVSQSVEPLDESKFYPALRLALEEGRNSRSKPVLTQHQVYRKMLVVTKPHSSVPGDIARPVIKRYPYLFANPVAKIFNKTIQSSEWPQSWKQENSIVLRKSPHLVVKSEENLRSISKTVWLSKLLEAILCDYILPVVNPYLDPGQCGGLKGSSTTHYLVKMLDFIHKTLDKRTPHCAVLATEDLSRAYNRGSHSLLIEDLHAMHLPGWLLALTCSYLSRRTMILSYLKARSSLQHLPGGFGAGTIFGGIFFIIKFNGVCLRPPIPRPLSGNSAFQAKYIDDCTQIASVNMRASLIPDSEERPRPLNFHERTQMILKKDENVLQQQMDRFHKEASDHKLVVNIKKCFIMAFSRSRKHDFPPEFKIGDSQNLEVCTTLKILGVQIQSDLKWNAQCQQMISRASSKIWVLRRMKALGLPAATLRIYWATEGRTHLEMSPALWHGSISMAQSRSLEKVQRLALSTITSWTWKYQDQLDFLGLERLDLRRNKLCLTFAKRTATKSRHQDMFQLTHNPHNIRTTCKRYVEPRARTTAYRNSAVPSLTRLLNSE